MKMLLVFDDWRKNGKSIYRTEKGIELSIHDFHSGAGFLAQINLEKDQEDEMREALQEGCQPVFWGQVDDTMIEGTWPKNDIRRAFVAGTKWWEFHSTGATMWQSDQRLAEIEAGR